MNNETKEKIKKNVATGASTVGGATAGVVIGAAVNTATAEEVVTPETTSQPEPKPVSKPQPAKPDQTEPIEPVEPVGPLVHEPEVEVVGYDRLTDEDGSQIDIAVLNVDGDEVGVLDANLDGEADLLINDANQDGVIDEGETQIVQGEGIAMQPFQDAVGFDPQYAQNDIPDYVNNADVDTYMA